MVTRYGVVDVVTLFAVGAITVVGTFAFVKVTPVQYVLTGFVVVVLALVVNFFRDPERVPPIERNVVLAPADGKVVVVKNLVDEEYVRQDAVQVSIFMSPLDVHVNRFPINGTVEYVKSFPGVHTAAFDEKSSERNERTHIGVNDSGYRVLFKQIAGTVARRIVARVTIGQRARAGERFGMIKFGSRVDVIMPRQTELNVRLNDRVRAGETIIARYAPTV